MVCMLRKIFLLTAALGLVQPLLFVQTPADVAREIEVNEIMNFLAADSMKGRGNGRTELLNAGLFIGDKFKKSSLQPFPGNAGFFIPFRPFGGSKKVVKDFLEWN